MSQYEDPGHLTDDPSPQYIPKSLPPRAASAVVRAAPSPRMCWTGGVATRIHKAVDWLGTIRTYGGLVVAATRGKAISGVDVTVRGSRTSHG
jgi:hypothetical protein